MMFNDSTFRTKSKFVIQYLGNTILRKLNDGRPLRIVFHDLNSQLCNIFSLILLYLEHFFSPNVSVNKAMSSYLMYCISWIERIATHCIINESTMEFNFNYECIKWVIFDSVDVNLKLNTENKMLLSSFEVTDSI